MCNRICSHPRVKAKPSRAAKQQESWPYKVIYGNVTVAVYKRTTPSGYDNYMVAELVTPSAAKAWFSIMPERAANVLPMAQASIAAVN